MFFYVTRLRSSILYQQRGCASKKYGTTQVTQTLKGNKKQFKLEGVWVMWSNEYPTCHINNSLIVFSTSVFSTVQIKLTCTLYLARNCAVALFFSLWQLKALHPVWLEIGKWMPNMCAIGCTYYNQIAEVLVFECFYQLHDKRKNP